MKKQSTIEPRTARNNQALLRGCVASSVLASFLIVPAAVHAADPAGSASAGKNPAVKLESIPGTGTKRVVLTAKAAERLGIETGKVSEAPIVRKEMVGGLVIPALDKQLASNPSGVTPVSAAPAAKPAGGLFGGFAQPANAPAPKPVAAAGSQPGDATAALAVPGDAWVLVTLSAGEWERLAKDKPARLVPLATRQKLTKEVLAQPSGMAPLEDTKRSMLRLYYVVSGADHGLTLNQRMRVEVQLEGSDQKQKVVPYSAVYYDPKGVAWLYVSRAPLTYERQRITVDRIVGDLAVLSEGPPVDTPVVSVGASLLFGAEIFGK
jgi:hypothetical protein